MAEHARAFVTGASGFGPHQFAILDGRIVGSTRYGFDELGLERLEVTVDPDNVASQRVAEKAGFTREGLLDP